MFWIKCDRSASPAVMANLSRYLNLDCLEAVLRAMLTVNVT